MNLKKRLIKWLKDGKFIKRKEDNIRYDEVYEFNDYKKAFEASNSKKFILVPKKK